MKHFFENLIYLLKLIIKCGENERIISPKSMLIRTGYASLLHGSEFFVCVFVIHYSKVLET